MTIRMVTSVTGGSTLVSWDGVLQNIRAGTLVDIPPGSALEAAYGPENLADMDPDAAAAVADHAGVSN
jgi:hypothetical protein